MPVSSFTTFLGVAMAPISTWLLRLQ